MCVNEKYNNADNTILQLRTTLPVLSLRVSPISLNAQRFLYSTIFQ